MYVFLLIKRIIFLLNIKYKTCFPKSHHSFLVQYWLRLLNQRHLWSVCTICPKKTKLRSRHAQGFSTEMSQWLALCILAEMATTTTGGTFSKTERNIELCLLKNSLRFVRIQALQRELSDMMLKKIMKVFLSFSQWLQFWMVFHTPRQARFRR